MGSGATDNTGSTALGARVRELRRAAGLTQEGLAAGRFTKQYVSQIERGEVAPSGELLEWLAGRLGVERLLLETGVGTAEIDRIERAAAEVEELLDAHRYVEAHAIAGPLHHELPAGAPRRLRMATLRGQVWALVRLGRITEAAEAIVAERPRAEGADGSRRDQAELHYLTAVCCYSLSQMPAALDEFAQALDLLDASGEPDDRLRLDIHQWRSRCHRRERDWEAAHEDIERALELCEATGDARRTAETQFQASLAAYRLDRLVLARRYAEAARDLYAQLGDEITKARVLNNLAFTNHLLGSRELAIEQAREALAIFTATGHDVEAGYVLGTLAQMQQERGLSDEAETAAVEALALLGDRPDHVQEIGMAQLALARARLDRGRLDEAEHVLGDADESFARADSLGHQALALLARGDLERARQNDREAARLYREAATALQPDDLDFRD